ncbi:diguanylate cyclase family protein [Zavarzinella formosa]|uniref:hypothetical protein n=1 Tax=Zavarzinella formosa TaxID=360055 RepID=UPI00036D8847|nr:hypothetical protein [Zavarzinella formosa]
MKLFTSFIPQVQHVLIYGRWFTPSVVVLFLGLEMYGRKASSDVHDTVGAVVFMMILGGITIRHRANPIGWVKRLGAMTWLVARSGDRFKLELGPDLKGSPKLPRRLPLGYYLVVLALSVWLTAAATVWWFFPLGWRPQLVFVTYTGYLAVMSVLWGMIFVASLGGVYFPIMLLTRLARGEGQTDFKMSRRQLIFLVSYLAITTGAAWYLPIWPTLVFSALCWLSVVGLLLMPRRPAAVQLLWRYPGGWARCVSPRRFLLAATTVAVLLLTAIVVSASGGGLFGVTPDASATSMPLTIVMGNWLAWLTPGFLASMLSFVYLTWKNDPAQRRQPALAISGATEDLHKKLRRLARRNGWDIHFDTAEPHDVKLRLVPEKQSEALEFEPGWPLAVSLTDLEGKLVFERAARRDEIQLRRAFLRGLETLMKRAKNRTSAGGCGYWFAPHLWFIVGLTRDEVIGVDEEPAFLTEIVGPTYAEVFGLPVRQYVYGLLKGLQVDLIFMEDGVNHRTMVRLWRRLFELSDKSNGQRRAEDVHFQGMPKIRVLFHDFDVDEPFRSSKYPEPKFTPLGRLRVMHVFRDRGEHEEISDLPSSFDENPVPCLVG